MTFLSPTLSMKILIPFMVLLSSLASGTSNYLTRLSQTIALSQNWDDYWMC